MTKIYVSASNASETGKRMPIRVRVMCSVLREKGAAGIFSRSIPRGRDSEKALI